MQRLWASHPRLAAGIHLLICLVIAALALVSWVTAHDWLVTGGLAVFLLIMTVSLVGLTYEASKRHWSPANQGPTPPQVP
jgi:membrane protein YdbS with pleckstrin-like domain